MFDLDRFTADCLAAAAERAAPHAVRDVVARAVEAPEEVLAAIGEPRQASVQTLNRSRRGSRS